jgi:hypothetical protein
MVRTVRTPPKIAVSEPESPKKCPDRGVDMVWTGQDTLGLFSLIFRNMHIFFAFMYFITYIKIKRLKANIHIQGEYHAKEKQICRYD